MRLTLVAISLFACACGTNSSDDDSQIPVDCSMVTGADTFTVGLEKPGVGGAVDFKLMSISPAPAIRGNNDWIVEIDAMSSGVVGAPMDGATLDVSSYMPAHGHYSPIVPTMANGGITATGTAGQYKISPVNLWMPGLWQTTITVSNSTPADRAVFAFCVNP
jgi:hypothetical protein